MRHHGYDRSPMTKRQQDAYDPFERALIEQWKAHGEDGCGRSLFYVPYHDADNAAAEALARIMGWDHRSTLKYDHRRRICREDVLPMAKRAIDRRYQEEIPGHGFKKSTGAFPLFLLFTGDDEHLLGWCRVTPRTPESLGSIVVLNDDIVVGNLTEIPPQRIKNPNRPVSLHYEGVVTWPDGSYRWGGNACEIALLSRSYVYCSIAALEPGELLNEVTRLVVEEDGIRDRRTLLHYTADFIKREAYVVGTQLKTVNNIANAQGVPPQAVVRQLMLDFYGVAAA
jgi:hypothetical protein